MKMHSLSRSITIVCVTFLAALCAVLSVVTWNIYTNTLFERYRSQMASIIDYVGSYIDVDDMAQCAATYEESEKYKETQAFFDHFVDYYRDLHYLYIIQALDPEAPINIREICAANSTYEKENEPENGCFSCRERRLALALILLAVFAIYAMVRGIISV